jgi:hypothetical protein
VTQTEPLDPPLDPDPFDPDPVRDPDADPDEGALPVQDPTQPQ